MKKKLITSAVLIVTVYLYILSIADEIPRKEITLNPHETITIGGMEFVEIPGGTFVMGKNGDTDEAPAHRVTVKGFLMGKHEVTQKQYMELMGVTPSYFKGDSSLPVECVTWINAMEFCRRFSEKYNVKARLPYEAEWEYAARGGTTTAYYRGEVIDGSFCWYNDNSDGKTHPVGQKMLNKFGLADMIGNVWEWCMDWYGEDYYSRSPSVNPEGPLSGTHRVFRGGSWASHDGNVLTTYRNRYSMERFNDDLGFRVVIIR